MLYVWDTVPHPYVIPSGPVSRPIGPGPRTTVPLDFLSPAHGPHPWAGLVTPEGKEAILAFIEEGELFGELAVIDSEPRNEFAIAASPARVVAVPRDDMLWLMAQRADVMLSVTKLLGFRRRRVENRLRNIL